MECMENYKMDFLEDENDEVKYDIIDTKYNLKKFFKLLYREIDLDKEYIRVFQNNKTNSKDSTYSKVRYFNNIDELVNFSCSKYIKGNNTYFELASTTEEGGQTQNLQYRYFLAFDFDKKELGQDFNHKDVLNLFKQAKLHYHCLVDSGNGYHAYVCINKTNDFKMIQEVQEALCLKLKADKNAIKSTQILRIPYTFNIKDRIKKIKIVNLDNRNNELFKPYDIEFLHKMNCKNYAKNESTNIKHLISNTKIPSCIQEILEKGSPDQHKYEDLQKIVVMLRQRNKSLEKIKAICKEWNVKSNYNDNLEYRIEHIYNNLSYVSMNCKECQYKQECYSVIVSDFQYKKDDKIITVDENNMSKLKHSKRKGVKTMKANDLLLYSVLKLHNDGLYKEEILNELTYTKKKTVKNIAMSDKTLRNALKSLEENKFITVDTQAKNKKLYKISNNKAKVELTYEISYAAMFECVKGNISTEELRLYNFMRYLHHKEQRENPKALQGNLFQINQVDLAEYLGVTQQRISDMIINLLDEKILSIWYRQVSRNNGFEYNIYRLNY